MSKKLLWLSGAAILVLLIGLAVASVVFAQSPTPPASDAEEWAPGPGGPGVPFPGGGFGGPRGRDWTMFDQMAEALGLTPEKFFAELHSGKTVAEIAEAQGVDLNALRETMEAARNETIRQEIAQAVADGKMSQEEADWLLEGLEKGYTPMGRGRMGRGPMGRGLGRGGCPCAGVGTESE